MSSTPSTSPAADQLDIPDKQILIAKQTLASEILQFLFAFLKATETHQAGNQIFETPLKLLQRSAKNWTEIFGFDFTELKLKGEQFFINDKRVRPKPKNLRKLKALVKFLRSRGLVGMTLPAEPRVEDLHAFLWNIAGAKKGDSASKMNEDLRAKGLEGFEMRSLNWEDAESLEQSDSAADAIYLQLYEFCKKCFSHSQVPTQFNQGFALDQILFELNSLSDEEIIQVICKRNLTPSDHPLSHSAVMSAFLLHGWGKALGLPPFAIVELAGCGLAHPFTIVHAPDGFEQQDSLGLSRLELLFRNIEEFKPVWPLTDLQCLTLLEFPLSFGAKGIYELEGNQCYIHFFSRMLRIVVLFLRMIIPDRRRAHLTASEAIEKMLSQELGCDKSLVRLLVSWLGIYPMGSFVRLTTGEVGQVISQNAELNTVFRPLIRIFKNAAGEVIEKPTSLDLTEFNEKLGVYKHGISQDLKFADTGLNPEDYQRLMKSLAFATS